MSAWIAMTAWGEPPERVQLAAREVHLWRASTRISTAAAARLAAVLPPEEQARFALLRRASTAVEYVVGRSVLRGVLGTLLGVEPSALRFVYSAAGKPSLSWPESAIRFSMSHAGGRVLVAVAAARDVGVDIESIRPVARAERIARRIFPSETQAVLGALRQGEWLRAFLHAWTQREAVVKAFGGRLFTTPDPFPFRWPRPARSVFRIGDRGDEAWSVVVPPVADEAIATVVAEGAIERVCLWDAEGPRE